MNGLDSCDRTLVPADRDGGVAGDGPADRRDSLESTAAKVVRLSEVPVTTVLLPAEGGGPGA